MSTAAHESGFGSLVNNVDNVKDFMKQGKHAAKQVAKYVDERAKIEKQYGESLIHLHRNFPLVPESKTLGDAWSALQQEAQSSASKHIGFSEQLLLMVATPVEEFGSELKSEKERLLAEADKLLKSRTKCELAVKKAQDKFVSDETKLEDAKQKLATVKGNEAKTAKQKNKTEQAQGNYESSEKALKEALSSLEQMETKVNTDELPVILGELEVLERKRCEVVKKAMEMYWDLLETSRNHEQSASIIRTKLAEIDIDADVQEFVNNTKNENVDVVGHHRSIKPNKKKNSGKNGKPKEDGEIDNANPNANANAESTATQQTQQSTAMSTTAASSATAASSSSSADSQVQNEPAGEVSFEGIQTSSLKCRAIFNHEPEDEHDLPFQAGDIITKVYREENNPWWEGECHGVWGMFPYNYVQVIEEARPEQDADNVAAALLAAGAIISQADTQKVDSNMSEITGGNNNNKHQQAKQQQLQQQQPSQQHQQPPQPIQPEPEPIETKQQSQPQHQEPEPVQEIQQTTPQQQQPEPEPEPQDDSNTFKVRVEFDYDAAESDELSLVENEIIVVDFEHQGWYHGSNVRGESGNFPANYVTILE